MIPRDKRIRRNALRQRKKRIRACFNRLPLLSEAVEAEQIYHIIWTKLITINSWNEWGEGSYLEPDTENGMGYLEAVRDVFGSQQANGTGTAEERTVKN